MSTTAFPYIPAGDQYQQVTAYISLSEYLTAAVDVDTSNLVEGGDEGEQNAVLFNKIAIASNSADILCHQTLAATVDRETAADLYVHRDGTVHVNLRYWPLQQVDSFSVGPTPSSMVPLQSCADFFMRGRTTLAVPVGIYPASPISFGQPAGRWRPGSRLLASWQYVNGWPLALITADVDFGATAIDVSNTLAFYPRSATKNGRYKIFDVKEGNPETVTVSSVTASVPGGPGTLNLAAPTVAAHPIPPPPDSINISGMPDAIKQGVVYLTNFHLKARGAESIVLATAEGAGNRTTQKGEGSEDFENAMEMLERFDRVAM